MNKNVTIRKIRNSLYDANLDTEYREALASSMMVLNYVSDSPLNLYYGTDEERKEIEEIDSKILTADEISELIHMMMYKMRDDFQYIKFKPVAMKYLKIVNSMRKENSINEKQIEKNKILKPQCDFKNCAIMFEMIGTVSDILKKNNMYQEAIQMVERTTLSYDFDEAFKIINEYVEVIERSESFQYEEEEYE